MSTPISAITMSAVRCPIPGDRGEQPDLFKERVDLTSDLLVQTGNRGGQLIDAVCRRADPIGA